MASNVQKYKKYNFKPQLTLVTTADVPFSKGINKYAAALNVVYGQAIASFRINNGKYEFTFWPQ